MPSARTHTAALAGTGAHVIEAGADITDCPPGMVLAGLPDNALREARDRIRAAIINSGHAWPSRQITVQLSPARLPQQASRADLAIAVAVLAASGAVPAEAAAGVMFLGELGLDGRLRPVRGVLPAVAAAARAGFSTVIVAAENTAEAALVPGMAVMSSGTLTQVAEWLRGDRPAGTAGTDGHGTADAEPAGPVRVLAVTGSAGHGAVSGSCLPRDHPQALQATEICAAGGHHLSLLGPPGAPMAAAAAQVRDLLPDLAREQALEVTTIYSLAGTLRPDTPLITRPPLVAPHHTATMAAITGGGPAVIQPGAASLAHRGVLFLDQAPRYERDVLSALRQPLESGEITLARSGITVTFPARFILVIAASPCPCGEAAGPAGSCSCSPATRRRWLGRVSGPLLDRVDVKTGLHPAARTGPASDHGLAGHGPVVAHRVAAARQRAAARLAGTRWLLNAEVPAAELRRR